MGGGEAETRVVIAFGGTYGAAVLLSGPELSQIQVVPPDLCSAESPSDTASSSSQHQGSFQQLLRVPSSLSSAVPVGGHTDGSWKLMQLLSDLEKEEGKGYSQAISVCLFGLWCCHTNSS